MKDILALTAWLLVPLAASCLAANVPNSTVLRDDQGREIVAGGYVAITEDGKGTLHYTPDDYRRMVRMGASFQVIRTALGRLGGWPGRKADPSYLKQLDEMVRMGREAGLQTVFKLVVYDLRPFGCAQWDAIYQNTDGTQDAVVAAWSTLWIRYQDEPSVFGYDLLNEPQRGLDPDAERCCREQLLPTLRRLADAMHAISPAKWALYQPLYRETGEGAGPFLPMREPFGRAHVIYAPHLYSMDLKMMRKTLDRYLREAALSQAPLLLGEWGPLTDIAVDTDTAKQPRYTKVYEATANALDQCGIGAIKAWFCGTRAPLKTAKHPAPFTWAIFSDTHAVGHAERKYITDALARPRPLAVAGHIESYGYDFATRTLEVSLKPDVKLGSTEIFVSAERFYPDGFRVEVGTGLTLALKPGSAHLSTLKFADDTNREQALLAHFDAGSQRLVIKKWIISASRLTLTIEPLPPQTAFNAPSGQPPPASDPSNTGGWILNKELSDEFEGRELDTAKWLVQGTDGEYRSHFIGRAPSQFSTNNVRVEDGKLKLQTRWEPEFPFSEKPDSDGKKFENITTAAVISKKPFLYGYMEIRCKAAKASITSSFWATGNKSELDVFEFMGAPAQAQKKNLEKEYLFTLIDWSTGKLSRVWRGMHQLDWRVAEGFHVYGCEWSEKGLAFYADGVRVGGVTREELGDRWVLKNPLWVWVDSETFPWDGLPEKKDLPADFEIDYIRIWQGK